MTIIWVMANVIARGSRAEMAVEQLKHEEAIGPLNADSGVVDYATKGPATVAKDVYYGISELVPSVLRSAGKEEFELVETSNPLSEPIEGVRSIAKSLIKFDVPGAVSSVIFEAPDRVVKGALNILPGKHTMIRSAGTKSSAVSTPSIAA